MINSLEKNPIIIQENIKRFIVDVLSSELDSCSIESNDYETGSTITCVYKTQKGKKHYIMADYLYDSPFISLKTSSTPNVLRDFYLFFRDQNENEQLHLVKDTITKALDNYQVGSIHMKFSAQPMGELHGRKKIKLRYFIHKEFLQGKISFENYLNKFSFMNSRLKSMPYYYLEDNQFKCTKVLSFTVTGTSISIDLKNDGNFNNRLETLYNSVKNIILENALTTICEKFDIAKDEAKAFSEQAVKDYIMLMSMETI
jgi:hypothetical protein